MSAVKYGDSCAAIDMFIIEQSFRGKGYGYRMWKEVTEKLANRNICLDSALYKVKMYEKSGFKGLWQTKRFRGIGGEDGQLKNSGGEQTIRIVSVDDVSIADLTLYDETVFGVSRPEFLKDFLHQPGLSACVALNKNTADEPGAQKILGYGCTRLCHEDDKMTSVTRKIGPLFSESQLIASELFSSLLKKVPAGIPFYVDIPEANFDMFANYNMELVSGTTKMFTKNNWVMQSSKIYGDIV